MAFVPFDATEAEVVERQVLRPGVPDSMWPSLTVWLHDDMSSQGYVRVKYFHELQNNLDIVFGLNVHGEDLLDESQVIKMVGRLSEHQLLRVVDYRLYTRGPYNPNAERLAKILAQGRSKYEVVRRDSGYRLAERVPEGVQKAAEATFEQKTPAGALLKRAWENVYDLEPNDSLAYSQAVKAVEAAALPFLGITQETATLSHAVRAIEKRDASWRLPFLREHTEYPSRDVILGTLKSLYRGQRDRHGSDAYTDVTHDEAEAAVLLAVTLVGWFSRGLVQERDASQFG